MLVVGALAFIPALALGFFSAASMLVAIPTGVQIFAWIATLWLGKPVYHVPMLWLVGFLIVFVCGGLTGVKPTGVQKGALTPLVVRPLVLSNAST